VLHLPPAATATMTLSHPLEGHTKVLSGTKKERNQWVFFVYKGILGQRYYKIITIGRNSGFRTKMGELIILSWMVMRYARYGE
jgi:hypothetical protein